MSTYANSAGVMTRQRAGQSMVLAAPSLVAIIPSIVLLIQLQQLGEFVLFLSEALRLLLFVGAVLYLSTAHRSYFWSEGKPRHAWYAVMAIGALTMTNILASTAITISLQHHYGRLPFLFGLGR